MLLNRQILEFKHREICLTSLEKDRSAKVSNGVIAVAIVTPIVAILIAVCIILWLYKRNKVNMDFMQKEMELAMEMKVSS